MMEEMEHEEGGGSTETNHHLACRLTKVEVRLAALHPLHPFTPIPPPPIPFPSRVFFSLYVNSRGKTVPANLFFFQFVNMYEVGIPSKFSVDC